MKEEMRSTWVSRPNGVPMLFLSSTALPFSLMLPMIGENLSRQKERRVSTTSEQYIKTRKMRSRAFWRLLHQKLSEPTSSSRRTSSMSTILMVRRRVTRPQLVRRYRHKYLDTLIRWHSSKRKQEERERYIQQLL